MHTVIDYSFFSAGVFFSLLFLCLVCYQFGIKFGLSFIVSYLFSLSLPPSFFFSSLFLLLQLPLTSNHQYRVSHNQPQLDSKPDHSRYPLRSPFSSFNLFTSSPSQHYTTNHHNRNKSCCHIFYISNPANSWDQWRRELCRVF